MSYHNKVVLIIGGGYGDRPGDSDAAGRTRGDCCRQLFPFGGGDPRDRASYSAIWRPGDRDPSRRLKQRGSSLWSPKSSSNLGRSITWSITPASPGILPWAIVNVGSIAGITGKGSSLPYAVSKAAVNGLTKSLAHALVPDVRVTGVAPGAVSTRWWVG
ncbi:hypothetical protein PAPH110629_13340 [Paenibacillus phoenicis]